MPADKLGQYIRSELFLKRANEAVAKAVRELEAKGIKPVYITRQRQDPSHTIKSDGEEQK
ncbi:hypothetical protein PP715_21325 [Ralstonia solanacearum]|uniref:Uncharacterized protein n=2 Tax=Ralstonia solanacearum TaxID=305 RepID=A0A5H2PJ36_RALSL|nr:hypothetical protein [Ralstonia solanacearum]AEG68827.1 conserved hypothetical protein [Ralstonia solanacearum Po82]AMP70042.1 hypothetical protein UW163_11460 [Ralstonia solanacearum]AYB60433.1 hypothetical protein C2124_07405 [Ralstonia solanacearum]MBB6587261.1 hypothetical protein [Ralstonia solanacearum]MCG3577535.1 hypothetical protein [Ralstonia solanacearum]